jgi:hypothetical protein
MIKRWDNPKDRMIAADEGNFVYYGDHIAELERLRAEDHDYAYIAASVRAACIAAAKLSITTNPQSDYDEGWNSGIENAIDFMREVQP